jgi:ribosome maturation factor RimP
MQGDILARIEPAVNGIVESSGMELVHAEIRREGGRLVLRLYIDKEGGVTLDDCARVSRLVSAQMDAEDPIPDRYTLEVSSPGLDRPLNRDRDFARFAGHQVRVSTAAPLEGQRNFAGRLQGLAEGIVRLVLEGGREVAIPRDLITKARLADDDVFGTTTGARGRHA